MRDLSRKALHVRLAKLGLIPRETKCDSHAQEVLDAHCDGGLGTRLFQIAKRGFESSVSTRVSRIWNLMMSFSVGCQLTMGRDDETIV